MTATLDLLTRCRALGIDLAAGPDGALTWQTDADADPPAELLAGLSEHKGEVVALLAPPNAELFAEAEALLTAHRAELARLERELFRDGFPPVLARVLAIGRTVAERFIRDHALERARGWNPLELLRGLLADEVKMVRRLAAEAGRDGR